MEVDSIEMSRAARPRASATIPPRRAESLLPRTVLLGIRWRLFVYACVAALAATAFADFVHVFLGLAPSWEDAMEGPVMGGGERDRGGSRAAGAAHGPARSPSSGGWRRRLQLLRGRRRALELLVAIPTETAQSVDRRRLLDDDVSAARPALLVVAGTSVSRARQADPGRRRGRRARPPSAVARAFVATPLLHAAQRNHGAVVTDLMYPVADMTIGVLSFAVLSIRGWRLDRSWALLIAGFAVWLLGDSMWALQISDHALTGNGAATLCYHRRLHAGCNRRLAAGGHPATRPHRAGSPASWRPRCSR